MDNGRSAMELLFDATNVFVCTSHSRLSAVATERLETEAWTVHDFIDAGHLEMQGMLLRPASGTLMGHPLAPMLFHNDYVNEAVGWNIQESKACDTSDHQLLWESP